MLLNSNFAMNMRVSILQTDIVWANPEANIDHVRRLLQGAPKSDLYVLPEMWTTGFVTNPTGVADANDFALNAMVEMSAEFEAAICGSVAVCDGSYRNRCFFVYPTGKYVFYDKRHLFSFGGENEFYSHGEGRVIAEWCGVRFLLLTCYDLRFPVWSRNCNDYDAIIYVANWPETRLHVWDVLLHARAIENQCYVIAANRVGKDDRCNYIGGCYVIDAKGKTLAKNISSQEEIVTSTLALDDLELFRNRFRVLDDADKFEII